MEKVTQKCAKCIEKCANYLKKKVLYAKIIALHRSGGRIMALFKKKSKIKDVNLDNQEVSVEKEAGELTDEVENIVFGEASGETFENNELESEGVAETSVEETVEETVEEAAVESTEDIFEDVTLVQEEEVQTEESDASEEVEREETSREEIEMEEVAEVSSEDAAETENVDTAENEDEPKKKAKKEKKEKVAKEKKEKVAKEKKPAKSKEEKAAEKEAKKAAKGETKGIKLKVDKKFDDVKPISSVRTKICLSVLLVLAFTAIVYMATIIPIYRSNMLELTEGNIINTVTANGKFIPLQIQAALNTAIADCQKVYDNAVTTYDNSVIALGEAKTDYNAYLANEEEKANNPEYDVILKRKLDHITVAQTTVTNNQAAVTRALDNLNIAKNADGMNRVESLVNKIGLEGIESSYAFYVDSDGKLIYSPVDGVADENGDLVIQEFVDIINGSLGRSPAPQIITYKFDGKKMYASFYKEASGNMLVLCAEESDILSGLNAFYVIMIISTVVAAVVGCLIAVFYSNAIVKPIKVVNQLVAKIAGYDFTENEENIILSKRKDETGSVARAVENMRVNLKTIIVDIDKISANLDANAKEIERITTDVDGNSNDNSATSEQLSASMQETTATSETIENSIGEIGNNAESVNQLTVEGEKLAEELMARAEELRKSTVEASENTREIYADVKNKTADAIERSKAVDKINLLAKNIKDIASQTNLLSLNATIEAARAGEAGRGFAVVAGEIGKLADQSTETVNDITKIVAEVQEAVKSMSECLETTLDFLETTVLNDYDQFLSASDQYNADAVKVEGSMNRIHESMERLEETVVDISEAISGISRTISEAAEGVSDIAEKTSDTVALTAETLSMVEDNVKAADYLKSTVQKFKLD